MLALTRLELCRGSLTDSEDLFGVYNGCPSNVRWLCLNDISVSHTWLYVLSDGLTRISSLSLEDCTIVKVEEEELHARPMKTLQ